MYKEITLPFAWKNWDESDCGSKIFYNVEFLEDFGKIPKGYYISIFVDYNEGVIDVYQDDSDDPIYIQKFKAIPINE